MKNRSVKTVFLLAVTALMAVSCAQEAPKKEIGLQLYSVREEIAKDLPGSLDSIAKIGYTALEAAGYGNGQFYGMAPADFKTLVESKGMKVISSHIGHAAPTNDEEWAETMKWWDAAIADHQALGVKYIVQPWMGSEAFTDLEALKRYCDMFNAVGEKCQRAGISFGYHNHAHEFSDMIDSVRVFDRMMELLNPDFVFSQLDVYWATVGGVQPAEYMNKYPGRFQLLHIKDVKEIGQSGKVDFKAVYDAAENAGVKYGFVEHEAFDYPPFTGLKISFDYLNNADFVKDSYSK